VTQTYRTTPAEKQRASVLQRFNLVEACDGESGLPYFFDPGALSIL
jgi:hypothetical protein